VFRERLLKWTGSLDALAQGLGSVLPGELKDRAAEFRFGRMWESAAGECEFEVRRAASKAFSEFQGRLPVAR